MALGEEGARFLKHGLDALKRILPHVETRDWKVSETESETGAIFADADKRSLKLRLGLTLQNARWTISGMLQRIKAPSGVGAIQRTISKCERDLASRILVTLSGMLGPASNSTRASLAALRPSFDERVVAEYVQEHHGVALDLGEWFAALRRLAEQTYENKSLTFGCLVEPAKRAKAQSGAVFPRDFLERKRFRALSDGYRTAYRVSRAGALIGFFELKQVDSMGPRYCPEWCEDLANKSRSGRLGLALTRQGDILVLDEGNLAFTYRLGKWQYWNHTHIVDILRNIARVQKVPKTTISRVVRSMYRAALDVSFRRSGALFVMLRSRKSLHPLVREGEAIADKRREALDSAFDRAVRPNKIQSLPRAVLADLASLDGAIVVGNKGDLLAYAAVLEPRKKGQTTGTEGSRSKAAIGSSHYGLALKVSSDGDLTVYSRGKTIVSV